MREDDARTPEQSTLHRSPLPRPPLVPAPSLACTRPAPLLAPLPLCCVAPSCHQELPPQTHTGTWDCCLHLQDFIPGGEKKRGQCQRDRMCLLGQPSISQWDRVCARSIQGHGGLQGAVVPPSGHRARAPTAPLNIAVPSASLLHPYPTLADVVAHSSPCHNFSSPQFPQ